MKRFILLLLSFGLFFSAAAQTTRRYIGNANTTTDIEKLQSRPGAPFVIYLKFDPAKNASYEVKRAIWEQTADDWIMFQANVTTDEAVFDAMPVNRRLRCYFTTFFAAGGGSFDPATEFRSATINMDVNPTMDQMGLFRTPSHEMGHTFDLMHDNSNVSYYGGHGEWSAIMGSGGGPVSHWSQGEYYMAGNPEDDIAIIGSVLGFVPDDYPGTRNMVIEANGTVLEENNVGTITTRDDIDVFEVEVPANGTINLTAHGSILFPNLDIGLTLKDANGNILANDEPVGKRTATINYTVSSAGTYFVELDGVGELTPSTGWSDYASLGYYELGGVITGLIDFTDDIELLDVQGLGGVCGPSINPVITVQNNGSNTITSFEANIYLDGVFHATETITGSITDGNSAVFTLSPINVMGNHDIEIVLALPGGADQLDFNNSFASAYTLATGEAIRFTTNFMTYDGETPFSWSIAQGGEIVNSEQVAIAENGSTVTQTTCLNAGCYDVTVEASGQSCSAYTEYSGGSYSGGDVVMLDGQLYEARWWTMNPPAHGDWDKLGPCLPASAYLEISNPNAGEVFHNLSAGDMYPQFNDEICINSCNGPGTVTIGESGTNAAGPFSLCGGETVNIETAITKTGSFEYNLYHDGDLESNNGSGTFELTEAGTYYVEVVNSSDVSCSSRSNNIVLENGGVPTSPTFTTSEDLVCAGATGVNYAIDAQSGMNYEWTYFGTNATIVGTSEAVMINFAADATGGVLRVEVSNNCGSESVDMQVDVEDCIEVLASYTTDQTTICSGETILFTNISTGVSGSETYSWDFGSGADPATATGVGPHSVTYNTVGNASVSLIVTDGSKVDDSLQTDLITVEDCREIEASYSQSKTTLCGGETVIFTNASTGVSGFETYAWDFGTGATPATATGAGPHVVTYTGSGQATVSLNVTDGALVDDTIQTNAIEIHEAPEVTILGNIGLCENTTGEAYTTNSSLSNSSFAWRVTGNGTLATGQGTGSITADFTTQGTATIKVIETSEHNCTSEEAELQVYINDCSVIIAGYTVDQQEICTGESVVFTNTTTGATSAATYEWDFGTGATPATATGEGPHTVTYDGLAPATIQLTVTEGAKSDQFIAGYQVIVHGDPVLTSLGDLDVCEGSNLNLAGHITPEGGTYSGTQVNGTTYDAIQNGDELVTYDYLDVFGCDATATFTVTTHSLPLVSAAPMEVCELDGMTILSTGSPIGGTYTGTGVTAGSFDPTSGDQTLTYTYTDGNSCSAATTFDISVLNSIDPFVSIEALETSYCDGTTITAAIDNATISGNISGTTYSWFINGDQDGWVSAQTYTSSTLSDGDEIKVLMTLPASNCVTAQFYESESVLVQIEQTIIPEITAPDTILCTNASETLSLEVSNLNAGQNTWEWTKDGAFVGTQSSLLVGAAGLYEVTGTGGNCGSETATQEVVMINPEVRILTNGSDVASLTVAEEAGVELEAQSAGNVTFEWEGNGVLMLETSPLLAVNISAPSVFVVKVSEEGCNATDTVEINVSETFAVSPLITVNGNGINEAWDIQGLDAYESHHVMLHNKWGTQVFETTDYTNNPWSGMNPNSGELLPSGTYYYTIELNGEEAAVLTGFVTLMR